MMLLSLNLLLLVFFVLLNSMATKDTKHSDSVMAQVADGYGLPSKMLKPHANPGEDLPAAGWRAGVISRVQGVMTNRIELRVAPQVGNAGKVEIALPLSSLFDAQGRLVRPELLRNLQAAAGSESKLVWQVAGRMDDVARLSGFAAAIAAIHGRVEVIPATAEGLRVIITPGIVTPGSVGLQIQRVGEDAGGQIQGIQERTSP